MNDVIFGDCLVKMKNLPSNSIDLVITSPPYSNRRKDIYGGVHEDYYVQWFLPIAAEIKRVLKSTGSFFLNIKPHTIKGERSLYVFDLVLALKRKLGFWYIDEFCWTKNAFPGGYKGRFKNGFEPVYHFTKSNPNQIKFNPVACGTPMKSDSIKRAYRKQCGDPTNGSKMTGMNTTNFRHLKFARPDNVINANNVSNQFTEKSKHPATFPNALVEFFILSFTNKNDIVLDPFAGSGTTGIVSRKLERSFILIEKNIKYVKLIQHRLQKEDINE